MTSKTDFTQEEWFLLHSTPTLVGLIVLAADSSGFFGTAKETFAIPKGVVEGGIAYPDNAIIQALLREKEGPDGDPVKDSYNELKSQMKSEGDVEHLTATILENCKNAAKLLGEKASTEESSQYKAWVLNIANKVASAAKESSSKGTDRGKISMAEEALIDKIAAALDYEPSE